MSRPSHASGRNVAARAALLAVALAAAGGCQDPGARVAPVDGAVRSDAWETLEEGLETRSFVLPGAAARGPSLHVVRIDPRWFELRLLMASADAPYVAQTAAQWCRAAGLVAAINAGLYQQDGRTSVSLMRRRDHVNNGHLAAQHQAVLAFDPLEPSGPGEPPTGGAEDRDDAKTGANGEAGGPRPDFALAPVQIIDREAQPFEALGPRYGSLVQGIRMIALGGRNVWRPQEQRHVTAAIGVDVDGRVLLLFSAAPVSTHELVEGLLRLPLRLRNAMYLEGGPPAQLWLEAGGRSLALHGATGDAASALPVPNVIGVARRAADDD